MAEPTTAPERSPVAAGPRSPVAAVLALDLAQENVELKAQLAALSQQLSQQVSQVSPATGGGAATAARPRLGRGTLCSPPQSGPAPAVGPPPLPPPPPLRARLPGLGWPR
jgi:hypothetical protein